MGFVVVSLSLGNPGFPFGYGAVRDAKLFCKNGLCEAPLLSAGCDEPSDLLLIQGEHLLSASSLSLQNAAEQEALVDTNKLRLPGVRFGRHSLVFLFSG